MKTLFGTAERSSAIYGISYKTRSLGAQFGTEKLRFFVGTLSLKERNQIHHIEVTDDVTEIRRLAIYEHPFEIWSIAPCPSDKTLLVTVYNTIPERKASLWKVNESQTKLEEICQLGPSSANIKCVLWNSNESQKNFVVTIDENTIALWGLEEPKKERCVAKLGDLARLTTGSWNLYFTDQVIAVNNVDILAWDLKSNKEAFSIPNAHGGQPIRDVDVNPYNAYYFVTGGDDCQLKFWDFRNCKQPAVQLSNHSHWVWCVKYNRLSDAFVLSSSTDSLVNLWNISSLAFQNPTLSEGRDKKLKKEDHLIKSFDDHEDSVYAVCWGTVESNAWAFASLSYDGRLVANKVPKQEIELTTNA
jgi:WD40 repeat protein